MARHNSVGTWGEQVAVGLLVQKGYAIVETNWRMAHFEIDIIAMVKNRIVFVEVKTRTDNSADPLGAVDRRKQMRMARAAHAYVLSKDLPHEIQFDIVAISGKADNYVIEHVQDAFLPPLRTYR